MQNNIIFLVRFIQSILVKYFCNWRSKIRWWQLSVLKKVVVYFCSNVNIINGTMKNWFSLPSQLSRWKEAPTYRILPEAAWLSPSSPLIFVAFIILVLEKNWCIKIMSDFLLQFIIISKNHTKLFRLVRREL